MTALKVALLLDGVAVTEPHDADAPAGNSRSAIELVTRRHPATIFAT